MNNISTHELKQLENSHQPISFWQGIWRALVISSLTGSLLGFFLIPKWTIVDRSQIQIQGNRLIAKDKIYDLLSLSYPQSLWQIQTKQLSQQLEANPPIIAARVTRQLLPPTLIVTLAERVPIAMAILPGKTGFLDKQGNWIPKNFYNTEDRTLTFPKLKVIGFKEQYRPYWSELYHLIASQSIEVFEVNWQDATNLVLKTELGTVYLGSYSSKLPQKFAALDRMRKLPNYFKFSEIVYIDLSNPESPLIQKAKKLETHK